MSSLPESTTVKVSKDTVRKLAALQRSLHTRSMDETIEVLVRKRRKDVLDSIAGTDRVKSRKFKEEDHLEGRS
jgi:predicted CopG family antitoxin